jgi:hypothetical protein
VSYISTIIENHSCITLIVIAFVNALVTTLSSYTTWMTAFHAIHHDINLWRNGRSCLSMTVQDAAMGTMGSGDGCQHAEAEAAIKV